MLNPKSDEEIQHFDQEMISLCLDLAHRAAAVGEVPVGALVVCEGQILAYNHNRCVTTNDPTAHAELLVLAAAGQVRQSWRLEGCTLYVTLEPCAMCSGALVLSRIDRLVYGASDIKAGACRSLYRLLDDPRLNHRVRLTFGVLAEPCSAVLNQFFRSLR